MELDDENLEYVKEIHKMIQKVAKVKKIYSFECFEDNIATHPLQSLTAQKSPF